jgi:hypothetical protein
VPSFSKSAWRTRIDRCDRAQTGSSSFEPSVVVRDKTQKYRQYSYSPKPVGNFIEEILARVPHEKRDELRNRILKRVGEPDENNTTKWKDVWLECAAKALPKADHETQQAAYLINLACEEEPEEFYVADGIASIWTGYWMASYSRTRAKIIARGLLGLDDKPCPGATQLNILFQRSLRSMADTKSD